MLSQKKRLSKSRVGYVLKKGVRLRLQQKEAIPFFNITCLQNRIGWNRFCVIVSSKVAAKAVERNRIRRKIYEAIRCYEKESENKEKKGSLDIAVITKAPVKEKEYEAIKNILVKVLEEIPRP